MGVKGSAISANVVSLKEKEAVFLTEMPLSFRLLLARNEGDKMAAGLYRLYCLIAFNNEMEIEKYLLNTPTMAQEITETMQAILDDGMGAFTNEDLRDFRSIDGDRLPGVSADGFVIEEDELRRMPEEQTDELCRNYVVLSIIPSVFQKTFQVLSDCDISKLTTEAKTSIRELAAVMTTFRSCAAMMPEISKGFYPEQADVAKMYARFLG